MDFLHSQFGGESKPETATDGATACVGAVIYA